jgi:hypothetical protein
MLTRVLRFLTSYGLLGAGAALLLAVVEWVDVNIQLTPVFQSFSERIQFSTYFSFNLAVGGLIAILVGASASIGSFVTSGMTSLIARRKEAAPLYRHAAWLGACLLAGAVLNQQPEIHAYVKGLIRELEKFDLLRELLLNHERSTSYMLAAGLVAFCAAAWRATARSRSWRRPLRIAWGTLLVGLMGVAYWVDSRVEVQLYEHSLHHSMLLLNYGLSMCLVASLLSDGARVLDRCKSTLGIRLAGCTAVSVLIASLGFALFHFGKSQNLKAQVFFRTTQAKQYVELLQWALDFDRDGHSPFLGGGDEDDRRPDINPARPEVPGDGIDNNCIGGDLTQADIDAWLSERSELNRTAARGGQRLNVIYIFIDALRADHLGTYGYARNTSPHIDRLAARSSVFENAFTPAPNTFEAMPKFMQSSHWDGHFPTWTEVLARSGYNNLLFPRRLSTQMRYVKGMKVLRHRGRGLEATIDAVIETLGSAAPDQPHCAFVYATDPHRPYQRREQFNFGPSLIDAYDGEIAYTDAQLGRLFDWLEEAGRLASTLIVIMADHGESLGERNVYKHSSQLYNEQTRIPMIIYLPSAEPRRIADYVSSVDLGSTILSAVGIEPPKEYAGVSLLPLIRGEPFSHPPIFAEQTYSEDSPFVQPEQNIHPDSKKYMVITQDGFKLIYNRNSYTFELFDLKRDPDELRNLYDHDQERAASMRQALGRFIDVVTASRPLDADESQYRFGRGRDEDEDEEM